MGRGCGGAIPYITCSQIKRKFFLFKSWPYFWRKRTWNHKRNILLNKKGGKNMEMFPIQLHSLWEINSLNHFPHKCIMLKKSCHDLSSGQRRVIFWIHMMSASTRWYKLSHMVISLWIWRRRVLKSFAIHGCGGHLGHVVRIRLINFGSPAPWRLRVNRPSGYRGEAVWKCWRTTDS